MPRGNASISCGEDKPSHTEKLTSYRRFLKEEKEQYRKEEARDRGTPEFLVEISNSP